MLKITQDPSSDSKHTKFVLVGAIDDRVDFSAVIACTTPEITLAFDGVASINSFGLRKMILMTGELKAKTIRYEDCRVVLIGQFNMVPTLMAKAEVTSFYVPYECTGCDIEVEKRVVTRDAAQPGFLAKLNTMFTCDRCNRHLNFMEDETLYFQFVEFPKAG